MSFHDQITDLRSTRRGKGVRNLDQLKVQHICSKLKVFTPAADEIRDLISRAKKDLPFKATTATILSIAATNPDCFWGIGRRATLGDDQPGPIGFVAFLMLNQRGRQALLSGELDPGNPDQRYIVGQHEPPACIYVWALHARGAITPALALVMDKLQSPNYQRADFIARAATPEGGKFLETLGFSKRSEDNGLSFYHFGRKIFTSSANGEREQIHQDSVVPVSSDSCGQPSVSVGVVHDMNQFIQAMSIRSAVYIGDEKCPFEEEFDNNDFSCTHILGFVGKEPAGCLRVRYFADFAKFERLAVRAEYRNFGLARQIVRYASDLCRAKGYLKLCAHARTDKIEFWSKYKFNLARQHHSFIFSDHRYVEMHANLERHQTPITIGIDPYILLRSEGKWGEPGVLEASRFRPSQTDDYSPLLKEAARA